MNTPLVLQTIDLAQNDKLEILTLTSVNAKTRSEIAALIDIDLPTASAGLDTEQEQPAPGARNGTLSQSQTGGPITYTPSAGFVGTDTFHYWACPAGGFFNKECSSASVTVTVRRPTTTTTTRPPSTTTTTWAPFEPSPTTTTTSTIPPTTTTTTIAPTTTTEYPDTSTG